MTLEKRKVGYRTLYRVEGSLLWSYTPLQAIERHEYVRLNSEKVSV